MVRRPEDETRSGHPPEHPEERRHTMRDFGPYLGILELLTFIMVLIIFLKVTGVV